MKNPPLKMTAAMILLVALGGGITWRTVSRTDREMRDQLLQQARLLSQAVPFERIKTLACSNFSLAVIFLIGAYLLKRRAQTVDNAELHLQAGALNATANAIVITDAKGVIKWINHAFTRFTGYTAEEAVGKTSSLLKSGKQDPLFYENLWKTVLGGDVWQGEIVNRRKDGSFYTESMTITPIKTEAGGITHFVAVKQDITKQKQVQEERHRAEIDLRQAQKMESVGNLAAGMAHEINSPLQSMHSNIQFLSDAFSSLFEWHQKAHAIQRENLPSAAAAALEAADQQADLAYFFAEIPLALQQSKEAMDRVTEIVYAMKEFSRPREVTATQVDLNLAISSTLTVCRNEWKQVARLVTSFEKDLPLVSCVASEINQVLLNLVVNAAHAIASSTGGNPALKDDPEPVGIITVSTRHQEGWVEVRVTDNGPGMSEAVKAHVFDPFYTTKEVGKGTGLGLLIAYAIIEKKHGGKIRFETEVGVGTTFFFRLPLAPTGS